MARRVGSGGVHRARNSTADRALDILLMFDDQHLTLTAADVARRLDVTRSTAYRYLQSLTSTQFVEEADGSGYRLGRRVLELARLARRGLGLSEVARPVMRRVVGEVGEAVLLTRLAGSSVICLEREEAAVGAVRISYERGQILPINAGAGAHILLAWLPHAHVDAILRGAHFEAFTERTLTTVDDLHRRLGETRRRGYAVSRGELDPDVLGVAAPIHNAKGDVTAAISVAAVSARVPEERVRVLVEAACSAAEEISSELKVVKERGTAPVGRRNRPSTAS